jgi:hypothetical protein
MRGLILLLTCSTLVVALLLRGEPRDQSSPGAAAQPGPVDLGGVDELKALFNHDAGKIRLLLLVSPT